MISARVENKTTGEKAQITMSDIQEKVETLEKELEENNTVVVKNGTERTITVKEAIVEIWEAVEPFRDLKNILKIAKKYPRLTRLFKFGSGAMILLQIIKWVISYKQWIMSLIK